MWRDDPEKGRNILQDGGIQKIQGKSHILDRLDSLKPLSGASSSALVFFLPCWF